jgi:integrase/recombinase XerC
VFFVVMVCASKSDSTDTLAHWRHAFERHLKSEKRCSAYTVRNYSATLALFEGFLTGHLGAPPTLTALSALEAKDFRGFLVTRRVDGLSPPSIKLELSALKSFYKFLHKRASVENDAIEMMRGPKAKERLPRPIAEIDARAMLLMAGGGDLAS